MKNNPVYKFLRQEEKAMYDFMDIVRNDAFDYHLSSIIIGLMCCRETTYYMLMMIKRDYFLKFFDYVYYNHDFKEMMKEYERVKKVKDTIQHYDYLSRNNFLLPIK